MSDQNELRDRIAKVHFANSARIAAEQLDLDPPIEWGELTDHDRAQLLDSAQAIIDDLGLTVEERGGFDLVNFRDEIVRTEKRVRYSTPWQEVEEARVVGGRENGKDVWFEGREKQ